MDRTERLIKKLPEQTAALIHNPSNIFYLSGYTGEGLLLVARGLKAVITDFRYVEAAEKQCPGFEVHAISAGVSHVKLAGNLLEKHGIGNLLYEDNVVTVRALRDMEKAMPENMTYAPLNYAVEALRTVKDAEELKAIRHACDITCQAFEYICGYIKEGMTERQVQLALDYKMLELGAQGMAFDTIVASGENGSLPHAVPGDRVLRKGDLITMDYGAKVDGYCSDMTRTVALGEPSDKLREIYNIVLRAQETAQAALAPGKVCSDMDKIARDIIADAGYGECFGHSLGHGVGIDIHEEPRLSSRSTDVLAPGHIVTVEPGIYVPGLGGVRIENTCVITETGYEALCSASKELRIL
ncbi:MAG: aminopeptidase P family protein [Clostridia bacterium]|nr:aminopeptidase P family protein [Clostridia bacterium]